MDLKTIGKLLVNFAEENKQIWNELDAAQGDGDLGVTILLGAQAMAESAESCANISEWFQVGGKALRKSAPSTMGILIASALIAAGKAIQGKESLTLEDWIIVQETVIREIQKRGGAKLGDKTVLDALIPAAKAFSKCVREGKGGLEALGVARDAALESAKSTASMIPKIGRSSWIGERAKGNVDGGAWVCYQIYDFLYTVHQQNQSKS